MAGDYPEVYQVLALEFGYDDKEKATKLVLKGQHPAAAATMATTGASISPVLQCIVRGNKVQFSVSLEGSVALGEEELSFDIHELADELKALLGLKTTKKVPNTGWAMPTADQLQRKRDGRWKTYNEYMDEYKLRVSSAAGGQNWAKLWPKMQKPVYLGLVRYYQNKQKQTR